MTYLTNDNDKYSLLGVKRPWTQNTYHKQYLMSYILYIYIYTSRILNTFIYKFVLC